MYTLLGISCKLSDTLWHSQVFLEPRVGSQNGHP